MFIPAKLFLPAVSLILAAHPPATAPGRMKQISPNVVRITAKDFSYSATPVIPAGVTEFRLMNLGPDIHHAQIIKLDGRHTLSDLQAAMKKPGPPPGWAHEVGGVNAPAPGDSANATVSLTPGTYVMMCFVETNHQPHFMKGMVYPFKVVSRGKPANVTPAADLALTLFDYGFKWSEPVTAGRHIIHVVSAGTQHHEVEIVWLAPGKTPADLLSWIESHNGPPPGKPLGGIPGLDKGREGWFTMDFAAGNYGVICFLPDRTDGKPHFVHGMTQQFAVK